MELKQLTNVCKITQIIADGSRIGLLRYNYDSPDVPGVTTSQWPPPHCAPTGLRRNHSRHNVPCHSREDILPSDLGKCQNNKQIGGSVEGCGFSSTGAWLDKNHVYT